MALRQGAVEKMVSDFWRGRRVLLTGHTGFKGAWTALALERLGAVVTGLALAPEEPSLFAALAPWSKLTSRIGDLRDPVTARDAVAAAEPEIILHMAAQALVRRSYDQPQETFATNVMGTVNLLEAARAAPSLRAILVVTSDKVYRNDELGRRFVETDPLGGKDPYSASKAAQEIVAQSYRASFFKDKGVALATARAGNVIGGGDWAADRLVPDAMRAFARGDKVVIRHPEAVRPWQHVLEPVVGYLGYAQRLASGEDLPPALNFGPAEAHTVGEVVQALTELWGGAAGCVLDSAPQPAEAGLLSLDPALAGRSIGWHPRLSLTEALTITVEWYRAASRGADLRAVTLGQLDSFLTPIMTSPHA